MSTLDFIREWGPDVGGMAIAITGAFGIIWFLFQSAVTQAIKPEFEVIKTDLNSLKTGQNKLEAGQDDINKRLDRLDTLLERERV